ncbi:MAG: hypothetical protein IPL32_19320 [Chloracidobacterium sp.]|nr:hypothetical protein [Chloracidobacterium sp.]
MTDDKGDKMESEGPYKVVQPVGMTPLTVEGPTGNHGHTLHNGALCNVLNAAYANGRKAEREWCAKIAEGYFHARGRVVAKAIRGGQDEK